MNSDVPDTAGNSPSSLAPGPRDPRNASSGGELDRPCLFLLGGYSPAPVGPLSEFRTSDEFPAR